MIGNARAAAALPAQDLERAKAFYRETLGLTPVDENPGGMLFQLAKGTGFLVFLSSGKPSGTHTQMAIEVDDLDEAVKQLRAKGVKFEEYDSPTLKTVDGIAVAPGGQRIAWFKDSEGNLIGIGLPVPVASTQRS
jgi:predicted enzyme related to lactoylglutathione lyase